VTTTPGAGEAIHGVATCPKCGTSGGDGEWLTAEGEALAKRYDDDPSIAAAGDRDVKDAIVWMKRRWRWMYQKGPWRVAQANLTAT
jgi:hypothetical protein